MVHKFQRDDIARLYKEHCCEKGARILFIGNGCLRNLVWNGDDFVLSEEIHPNEIDHRKCQTTTAFVVYKHGKPLTHPQYHSVQMMPDLDLQEYIKYLGSFNHPPQDSGDDFKVCVYEHKLRAKARAERIHSLLQATKAKRHRQDMATLDRSA